MFIQDFFDKIFGPFRRLRSTIFNVQQIPSTIKGQINRGAAEAGSIKGEFANYKNQAGNAANKAKNAKVPQTQVKKKMSLFSKKVACEGCGQKLHPSWDECPYCGFKKGAGAPAGAAAAGGAAAPSSGGGG